MFDFRHDFVFWSSNNHLSGRDLLIPHTARVFCRFVPVASGTDLGVPSTRSLQTGMNEFSAATCPAYSSREGPFPNNTTEQVQCVWSNSALLMPQMKHTAFHSPTHDNSYGFEAMATDPQRQLVGWSSIESAATQKECRVPLRRTGEVWEKSYVDLLAYGD